MTWAEAVPNLLIGLREGLEAGLVVSILLAALRKTAAPGAKTSSAPVWLGVVGAVAVAGSFAAVLTFSTDVLSSSAQEAVGGSLSVLAVGLVTAMVFWMRKTAAGLSRQLRGEVARAVAIGSGALAVTAFLAVGREGLETTLFLWTAAKASGSTVAPLVGAGIGLVVAIVLCWLLFRQAVRLNLGVFFNRTALALIVIAAGVFAYGLGDLQDAGIIPGTHWVAFDLSSHIDPNAWWVTIITGVTELTPRMTVLQVVVWAVYLAIVLICFYAAAKPTARPAAKTTAAAAADGSAGGTAEGTRAETGRHEQSAAAAAGAGEAGQGRAGVAAPVATKVDGSGEAEPSGAGAGAPGGGSGGAGDAVADASWWERAAGRRPWSVAGVLIVVPAAAAATTISLLPAPAASAAQTVTVTKSSCAKDWTEAHAGTQTFKVDNESGKAGEINLVNSAGAIVAEIETIGPATTADMTGTLGSGSYTFKCLMSGSATTSSPTLQVAGAGAATGAADTAAVAPVTAKDLTPANDRYQAYAAGVLQTLAGDVRTLQGDLKRDDRAAAQRDWLAAQQEWERVGASYNSFGDLGTAVDGLPDGLQKGVDDPSFTGLHRLEYGLWHGRSASELMPVADRLAADIGRVRKNLGSDDLAGDPVNLPTRAHEILEDAQRDHLSGMDDEGAGAAYAMTDADVAVTRTVLGELQPLLAGRAPALAGTLDKDLDGLESALQAAKAGNGGTWPSIAQTPTARREAVDAALGQALEDLSQVPNLLEVPPTH
ncbi:iron uptake transporter permease EfeU [Phaeacidiphilus oryzae]|uniref:iron uptake transporter permease EfeU n=1 Tax=Phaeacidiphilus oryzae TaxID=348818 RepID=UPI0005621B02|nr:iron uptake transporter permease EfeU [Phaeacidiphilus oryzae]